MPPLSFRLKKRADANAQLILVRADGSYTIGDIGPHAGYGPAHDLAHFVIESTLGLDRGFLGLVASGWSIGDFEVKGAPARLPAEALFAERAAGELSRQHLMGQPSTVSEFNWAVGQRVEIGSDSYVPPEIPEVTLEAIRARLLDLHLQWLALPVGETLELSFGGR